jgi:serine/threonine-protein kinase
MILSPTAKTDRTTFLATLRRSNLLTAEELDGIVWPDDASTAKQAASYLVQTGALTRFQAERLLIGKADGFHIGQYVILEPLRSGKVGQVFKALHRGMNRLVTVELLSPTLSRSTVRHEFLHEIRRAARLTHPNLITILDANEAQNRLYFVLEYVDGLTIDSIIRSQGPFIAKQACEYARQAALGLAHAHSKGIVHGALSPASLLLGRLGGKGAAERYVVKVLNVGLSRLALYTAETGDLQAAATAAEYLAPEQLLKPDKVDARTDLYALGCTLYFLLTGAPPRALNKNVDGPLLHQFGKVIPIEDLQPNIPVPLAALVRHLMEPDPVRRPDSAAEVASRLAVFSDSDGHGSSVEFSLPPIVAGGPVSGFLSGLQPVPADRVQSPFAELQQSESDKPISLTSVTYLNEDTFSKRVSGPAVAGLFTVAAAIIALTGITVSFVIQSMSR